MLTITLRAPRRDLALYQDTVATFSLAPISDRFEMLRQLGNVFIVQPDILRSYLQEGYLARIENRLLRPFVMCRSDYGDYPRKFWDDVFGPDETAATGATAGAGAGAVGAAAAQLGTQAGGAIASTLNKLPRLGNFGSGTSAFSAQMQSLRASVATKKDGGSSPTTDGRFSPVPASPRIPSAPGPPPPPPPRGGGGGGPLPPSLPPRSAPSPVLHQRPPSRSGTPDPSSASGPNSSISRKPSLFNSLMRDFEGLGLRDDGTGEFGTPAGGGAAAGAGAGAGGGRGSVADGSGVSKRGSLQSIRSARSVRE